MNKIKKLKLFLCFVVILAFCCLKVAYAEDSDTICCKKPATHTAEGKCCNGPNDDRGNFSKECCEAKGGTAKKRNGQDICCKNQTAQNS